MMAEHPPAPDLGAIRARHVERPIVLPSGVPATYCPACGSPWPCDAARLYDAQATRLAAMAPLVDAVARALALHDKIMASTPPMPAMYHESGQRWEAMRVALAAVAAGAAEAGGELNDPV